MVARRRASQHKQSPLTYSTGTTPGEQEITASTTAPSTDSDGFPIADLDPDTDAADDYFHPPEFLDVVGELTGTAEAAAVVAVSIWFYFPDAGTTNKWRESAPMYISGSDQRGSKGYNDSDVERGNCYKIDVPAGAIRAFLHAEDVPADVDVHILVHPYNN